MLLRHFDVYRGRHTAQNVARGEFIPPERLVPRQGDIKISLTARAYDVPLIVPQRITAFLCKRYVNHMPSGQPA